ncbi:unnamed protein product [Rhodiola kirilowii]
MNNYLLMNNLLLLILLVNTWFLLQVKFFFFPNVYTLHYVCVETNPKEKVREILGDQNEDESEEPSVLDEQGPLPLATELDIITQVMGQKRGTYISGTGKSFKKPPLPRGGARNSELKDQLQQQKEEFLEMKAAFEDRIHVLEELVVRGGSTHLTSNNASEGVTSYDPAS